MTLRQAIQLLQEAAHQNQMEVIIVGGAVVRLFGPQTAIKRIDEAQKTILLDKALTPKTKREDKKTIVDIDCIAFSKNTDPFNKTSPQNFINLQSAIKNLQKTHTDFPAVSIEPVLYHPYFTKPHTFMQFVSSIESYHRDNFFFRLGQVKQDVQKKSLTPWTLLFTDSTDSIVTLMPTALQKRYVIRGFGIKPKDREKIFDKDAPFAQFVANFRIKTKGKYDEYFSEWDEFAGKIKTSRQPTMAIKRHIWHIYWHTIGTYFAHGTGFLGKLLLPLGGTLFAGK